MKKGKRKTLEERVVDAVFKGDASAFHKPTKQKMFEYLDDLRESGVVNMFGARPYVAREFGLSSQEASAVLSEWMKTFSDRHPSSAS